MHVLLVSLVFTCNRMTTATDTSARIDAIAGKVDRNHNGLIECSELAAFLKAEKGKHSRNCLSHASTGKRAEKVAQKLTEKGPLTIEQFKTVWARTRCNIAHARVHVAQILLGDVAEAGVECLDCAEQFMQRKDASADSKSESKAYSDKAAVSGVSCRETFWLSLT